MNDFVTSNDNHLENTHSLSYADLPNVNMFYYRVLKILVKSQQISSEKLLRKCQDYISNVKYSKILIFT